MVVDENKNLLDKDYLVNLEEVLLQENVVETIENSISNDKMSIGNWNSKVLKNTMSLCYESIFTIFTIALLIAGLLMSAKLFIAVSGGAFMVCGATVLTRIYNIKKYEKQINAMKYKVKNSEKELNFQKKKLAELSNSKIEENIERIPDDRMLVINDANELKKIERNLKLGYLYKLKETIIDEKIKENNDNALEYISKLSLDRKKLNSDEQNIVLKHALRKTKVLKKED